MGYFKRCEPASQNGIPSMDLPSRSLLGAFCLQVAWAPPPRPPLPFGHAGLFSRAACYALPFFCYPKQRVRPILPAVMRTYETTRSGLLQNDKSALTMYSRQLFVDCSSICAWPSLVGVFGGGSNNSLIQVARPEGFPLSSTIGFCWIDRIALAGFRKHVKNE